MEPQAQRAQADPLLGSVLHERYRVLRRIGRGGMGIVYLAEHVLIGRKYAIKTLSERANASDEMVARFHREALAAAALGNEHIVEVTDMGRLDDGTYFIVLEYLDGAELAELVCAQGPLTPERAVRIACQLCDALSEVHAKGIVHRDLKPENLFLIDRAGSPDFLKVLDFGVCKLLEPPAEAPAADQAPLTRTNASLGTPQYMAPEQFHASARVDGRADLYAVGAILYFMLSGKPPFDAPSLAQLFMRVCVDPPPALLPQRPDLPQGLEAVIRRALHKQPEERFASAAELKRALLPFTEVRASAPGGPVPTLRGVHPAHCTLPLEQPLLDPVATAPALEARRRQPPLWAGGLLIGICGMLAWGAWATADYRAQIAKPESRVQLTKVAPSAAEPGPSMPASATQVSSAPRSPAQQGAPAVVLERAKPRRPQAKVIGGPAPLASQAAEEAAEPARSAEPGVRSQDDAAQMAAPPAASVSPASTQTESSYAFPRRALKDVF